MSEFLGDFEAFTESWWPYIITLVITIISALKIYVGGTPCPSQDRIDGKVVIVTGANSGIGFETAKELANRGGRVILAVRNAEKGKNALIKIKKGNPRANVNVKLLDVSDLANIKEFVKQLEAEFDKVDVLVNNAGIIFHPYKRTIEGNELTFVTNYLGPFLLTHLLLPLLSRSDNGRVINVSALAHYNGKLQIDDLNCENGFDERNAFAQSKLALTMFSKYMASLYKNTNLTFNSVNPGLVRNTEHLRNSTMQTSMMVKISVWPWIWLFMKTPKQGCQSIVYLAVSSGLKNVSGRYFSDCEIKEPAKALNDQELLKELYEKSCQLVNIDGKEILGKISNKFWDVTSESEELK